MKKKKEVRDNGFLFTGVFLIFVGSLSMFVGIGSLPKAITFLDFALLAFMTVIGSFFVGIGYELIFIEPNKPKKKRKVRR